MATINLKVKMSAGGRPVRHLLFVCWCVLALTTAVRGGAADDQGLPKFDGSVNVQKIKEDTKSDAPPVKGVPVQPDKPSADANRRLLYYIYPGEGLGNVRIGDKMREVVEKLDWGKPDENMKSEEAKEYYWIYKGNRGVTFVFSQNKRVFGDSTLKKITITNPVFSVLGSLVHVSMKMSEMRERIQEMKKPYPPHPTGLEGCRDDNKEKVAVVECEGLRLLIDEGNDRIKAIEVFQGEDLGGKF